MQFRKQFKDKEYYCYIEELDGDREDLEKPYWRFGVLGSIVYKRGNAKTDAKYKKILAEAIIAEHKKDMLEEMAWHIDEITKIGRASR